MLKKLKTISFALIFISLLVIACAATAATLPLPEQKEKCLEVIKQIREIDRTATQAGDKLKDAINQKKSASEIIPMAKEARDAAQEAQKAYERVQLNLPDGLQQETESALNECAYEMKLAYATQFAVYRNYASALEKNENATLDQSNNGKIWGHMGAANEAMNRAKKSLGIED